MPYGQILIKSLFLPSNWPITLFQTTNNKILLEEEGIIGIISLQGPRSILVLDAYKDRIAEMVKKKK